MRIFCRADHTPKVEVPPDYEQELLEERAELARLKAMPVSAFAEKSHKAMRMTSYGIVNFSVDNKADAIARKKAKIAKLKILATPKLTNKEA